MPRRTYGDRVDLSKVFEQGRNLGEDEDVEMSGGTPVPASIYGFLGSAISARQKAYEFFQRIGTPVPWRVSTLRRVLALVVSDRRS